MHVQTSADMGTTSKPLQFQDIVPGQRLTQNYHTSKLTPSIEVFLSILESSRLIADGLTLVTSSLRGWEAFPTPGALTHTGITWALSPTAPQVPGTTPGSPLCKWCFGHFICRGARHQASSK